MKISILFISIWLTVSFLFGAAALHKRSADLILYNGIIHTVDGKGMTANALAISGDKILLVGKKSDVFQLKCENTVMLDLKGRTAIPGFNESHGHFMGLGESKKILDLKKSRNWADIVSLVKSRAKSAKKGEWIIGRGWHQEKWERPPTPASNGIPYHAGLSAVSTNHPVILYHASGHSCFINEKAMKLAGINEKTKNPAGGEIVKDRNGKIIGLLRETAMSLVRSALNRDRSKMSTKEKLADAIDTIELAQQACLENGVTSFTDAGVSFKTVELYKKLAADKKLKVRLNVMVGEPNQRLKTELKKIKLDRSPNAYLRVASIKRLLDGALGSHGAWLLKPYLSLPSSTGLNTETIAYMKETAKLAAEYGYQLCTHAIGDRANRETLDIYEREIKRHPKGKQLRWRVEHAQHLDKADIPRFSQLNVIAAMQGIHCTSDGPWVPKRIGDKRAAEGAYVWRTLLDLGTVICNGTDVPVEDVDPLACFYSSVTRMTAAGKAFYPAQKMNRTEALASYTINGAYAAFEEDIKGSLTVGKLADITVLSDNIMTVPEEKIKNIKVMMTIVGGKIRYRRPVE